MNYKLLSTIAILSFFLAIASVNAAVSQVNNVFYGELDDGGALVKTSTAINDFNTIGFICSNDDCSNIGGTLWNGSVINSANSSQVTLTFPTTLQQKGYGLFFYKEGYFPYEVKSDWSGNGQAANGSRYLTKKINCEVPIHHLIISHYGNNVTVNVTLDSKVSSPVQSAGPLNYVPSSIAHLYAVDSKVDFRFIGPQNVTLTENVNLPASESREISVSTNNLAAGDYRIEIESNTVDVKCINSIANKLNSNLHIAGTRVNETLPLIGILSPLPQTYNNRTILVNLRAINATNVFYSWNGVNITYTNPVYVTFSEGSNTLTAYAQNNLTTAFTSVTFMVNTAGNHTNQTNHTNHTNMPPASITNLMLKSKNTNSITWNWTNPADSDFNSNIIYINGVNVANISGNSYTASGLASNTFYTITVNTKDNAGNINRVNVSNTQKTDSSSTNNPPSSGSSTKKKNKANTFYYNFTNEEAPIVLFEEEPTVIEEETKKQISWTIPLLLLGIMLLLVLVLIVGLTKLRR